MTISRRNFIGGVSLLAAATTFSVKRSQAAEFSYKLALELQPQEPMPKRMLEACKLIEDDTKGRLVIQGFPNGQLGNPVEELSQVRSGAVEFLTSSFGILSNITPAAGLPTLGFIFESQEKIWPAIEGELGNYLADQINKRGEIVVLPGVHDLGMRHVTSNKHFMLEPKDLHGFKVRTPPTPFLTSLFSALGASPTPIPFADLYTALQTGLVDGQENPLTVVDTFKFNEVQKFCTLTGHSWDGWVPVANKDAWERLPTDIRNVVSQRFKEAALKQRQDFAGLNQTVQVDLEKRGMQIKAPAAGLFRETLRSTSFYVDWKKKVGGEAWSVLENAVGKLV